MKYNNLSHTDLKVSLICLGTMTYGEQNSESESHEQLDYSLSRGINIDANVCNTSQTETQGRTRVLVLG